MDLILRGSLAETWWGWGRLLLLAGAVSAGSSARGNEVEAPAESAQESADTSPVEAETESGLRLGSPFGDHMVFQAERPLPVWGWDEPGQAVEVRLAGHTAEARADDAGFWRLELPAVSEVGPHVLEVVGSQTRRLEDVVAGEVWWCSGQSNMGWPMKNSWGWNWVQKLPPDPDLRLFQLPQVTADTPRDRVAATWQISDAASVEKFSGVGYFFGRQLARELDRPVGLMLSAWGGSKVRAWLPQEVLQANPHYESERSGRQQSVQRYRQQIQKWEADGKQGKRPAWGGAGPQHSLSGLYNAMVHPIEPYPVRGVIWYQGESDAWMPDPYADLFTDLVASWRRGFGDSKLPVFMVQLPNFENKVNWAPFRDMQRRLAEDDPDLDIAVTIDVGQADDIHPPNKQPVGHRLARLALAQVYGRDVLAGGPRPVELTPDPDEPGAVRVRFDRVGQGLKLSDDAAGPLSFVLVAGEQRQAADAQIVAPDTVRVHAPGLGQPTELRYANTGNPRVNLVNSEDLPATPFVLQMPASEPGS